VTPELGDGWSRPEAYDAYMGTWSRLAAREFLDWLDPDADGTWLEVGCGTGALTSAISDRAAPRSIVACDPAAPFIAHNKARSGDRRVAYVVADASALPQRDGGFDFVVSGLVLNFLAEPSHALAAMAERCHPGGVVAGYVWDYAGGVDLLRYFWESAVALDPRAAAWDEARRFGAWNLPFAAALFQAAGLADIEAEALTVEMAFASFDDYWRPFLGGAGPGPSYVASLPEDRRALLAQHLRAELPRSRDGTIALAARAWALRGYR
jgi:SAM-dependent methyltransferase